MRLLQGPTGQIVEGSIRFKAIDFKRDDRGNFIPVYEKDEAGNVIMEPVLDKKGNVKLDKDGKPFMLYKFRSMRVNVQQETGWSTDCDPRKTHFGSFIRKFSLDELPQFFNVLKGDMSLVGPRPEVPYHVEHFKEEIPRYLVRQQVRPGCTGWAQIHGLRGDTDIAERIRYDIWYIENWTVALDIKIIFRTVFGGKMVNDEKLQ